MASAILRKAGYLTLVVLGVSLLCFAMLKVSGRDPALAIALRAQVATEENLARLRDELGLSAPLWQQYLSWLGNLVHGDFGYSLYSNRAVSEDLAAYLPLTLQLLGLTVGWIVVLGTPLALLSALRRNGLLDHVVRAVTVVAICTPVFWLGYVLLIVFAVKIPLVTVVPKAGVAGLVLPSLALALPTTGSFVRVFRASLIKQMGSAYSVHAYTRGLSRGRVLVCHCLRNALPPACTLLCQYVGYLVVGTVLVESVFSLKGMGSYLLGCALASDAGGVAAVTVIVACVYAVLNIAADAVNLALCPWMARGRDAV